MATVERILEVVATLSDLHTTLQSPGHNIGQRRMDHLCCAMSLLVEMSNSLPSLEKLDGLKSRVKFLEEQSLRLSDTITDLTTKLTSKEVSIKKMAANFSEKVMEVTALRKALDNAQQRADHALAACVRKDELLAERDKRIADLQQLATDLKRSTAVVPESTLNAYQHRVRNHLSDSSQRCTQFDVEECLNDSTKLSRITDLE